MVACQIAKNAKIFIKIRVFSFDFFGYSRFSEILEPQNRETREQAVHYSNATVH